MTITRSSLNPSVFGIASSGTRSRTDLHHERAGGEQQREEHRRDDPVHDEVDVANALDLPLHELGLRLRVRRVRGVGEPVVDRKADLGRLGGVPDLQCVHHHVVAPHAAALR